MPNAAPSPQPDRVIQPDIVEAFSMKARRSFFRKNQQVYAIVGANSELSLLLDVWFDRFDTQEEFRSVLSHILKLFREGGYRFWLADLRFLASDFAASEEWLVKTLMPAIYDAGLEREAVVLPANAVMTEGEDPFETTSQALHTLSDGRVRGFSDINLAKRWLLDGLLPQ